MVCKAEELNRQWILADAVVFEFGFFHSFAVIAGLKKGQIMALVVNGEKIEDSLIEQEIKRLRPHYERMFKDQTPEQQKARLFAWSKENVIERVLINQQAKNYAGEIPTAEVGAALTETKKQYGSQGSSFEEFTEQDRGKPKEEIELQMKVEKLLREVCKDVPQPEEEQIVKFYNENKQRFKRTEQVRAAHIVKYVNWQVDEASAYKAINKARQQLDYGAAFEMIADKYTDCGDPGGQLGYITRGQMVEEFEDVVFNLDVNEVSEVFRTRFGYHIAKVYDRKPEVVRSLEEVEGSIVKELGEQLRQKAIEEYVDKLKDKAEIKEI